MAALTLILSGALPLAAAAPVCFYKDGTYAGLTVTTAGPGCGTFLGYGGINGLWMGDTNVTENCTFTIDPSVLGPTIKVELTAHTCTTQGCEEAHLAVNGAHYAVAASELDTTSPPGGTSPPDGDPASLTASGDILGATGRAPGVGGDGRATVSLRRAPPTVTSIDINHVINNGQPNGTIYLVCTESCQTPTGVTTVFGAFADSDGWPTLGKWEEHFTAPLGADFNGSMVMETDAAVGTDTCYFVGSAFDPATSLTGGTWNVSGIAPDATWGFDFVGWFPDPVAYYRAQGRAPCGFTVYQQMQIKCPDGVYTNYGPVNTLGGGITDTTITSTRAGQTVERGY